MNRFWKNKPLYINNSKVLDLKNVEDIVNLDIILENVNLELERTPNQLEYDIINKIDDTNIDFILEFINNYNNKKTLKYKTILSKDIFEFFYKNKNVLVIIFYNKYIIDTNIEIIGMIIGKEDEIVLNRSDIGIHRNINTIDIDYMCIKDSERNKEYCKYMINTFTKEVILSNYDHAKCANFISNKHINDNYFSQKYEYHRLLNMDTIFESGIINKSLYSNIFEKVYSHFSYSKNFFENYTLIYNPKLDYDLLDTIHCALNEYEEGSHLIYKYKKKEEILRVFNNPDFCNFLIESKETGEYISYISIYKQDFISYLNNETYSSGLIYYYCDNNLVNKNEILEVVSEYCKKNVLFDLLSIYSIYNEPSKFIKGLKIKYYYMYNMKISYINGSENGLI